MMQRLFAFCLLVLIALFPVGCRAQPSGTDVMPTEPNAGTPTGEPDATITPSPTASATPVTLTPSARTATAAAPGTSTTSPPAPTGTTTAAPIGTPTASPAPPMARYGFQVSYALDDVAPDDSDAGPPEGERWIVVVTAIQNENNESIVIERQSLALVDQQGNRYAADEPGDETQPPLVGARLEPGEDVLGLVRFTLPEDAEAATLEWCPGSSAPCGQPLTAPIP